MLLCAANLYPDPKIYLGFAMCLIKDYQDIPQRGHFEDCALEHAIDFDKLSDCASQDDGGFGVDMLRSSVRRSAEVQASNDHPPLETLVTKNAFSGWRYQELHGATERGNILHPGRRRVVRLPPWTRSQRLGS